MTSRQTLLEPVGDVDSRRMKRRNWMFLGILVIATILYVWKFNSFQVGVYMDDAEYVVLAKSIALGPSYGLINGPDGVQPTRYPFGWPLLLAPVYLLSGGNLQALKLVSFLATLANIAIIALLWQWLGLRTIWIGLATAAVYALLPLTVGHAGMVMSEAAFLTALLTCLALTTYLGHSAQQRIVGPILLGTIWVFTAFTRTIGLTAVMACFLYLAWRRHWQTILLSTVGLTASLILIIGVTPITVTDVIDVSEYQAQFSDPVAWGLTNTEIPIVPRALEGIGLYTRQFLRDSLIPFVGGPSTAAFLARLGLGWAPSIIGFLVTTLALAGYVVTLRSGFHPAHLFVPTYLAILVVWPWQGDRFLYGVLPFLIAYVLTSGAALLDWLTPLASGLFSNSRRWGYHAGVAALVFWLGLLIMRSTSLDSSTDHTPDQRVGTAWLRENAPPESIVAAGQPLSAYVYSERTTMPLTSDPQTIQESACQHPLFVLVAPKLEWRNDNTLSANSMALDMLTSAKSIGASTELVFDNPRQAVQVVRIVGACGKNNPY